ncbi:MAG: DUF2075 domain-containing protein [Candidatus Altiarchaeota archaeon]|nr:DUF2075 domain-containing protein [Candidatus Altiarchaeota archaeon]
MKRVSTGIEGLDPFIGGGIPEGFNVIVAGGPGTGKTIFGLQFIYDGVKKGEPGIYVSFEQFKEEIIEQAMQFGWNDIKNEKLFSLLSIKRENIPTFMTYLRDEVESKKAKRVVIDSLTLLSVYSNVLDDPTHDWNGISKDELVKRTVDISQLRSQTIYHLVSQIKSLGTTNVIIVEQTEPDRITKDGVSEFACDGLIVLKKIVMGKEIMRSMIVEKMRETNVNAGIHLMDFIQNGLRVR